MCWFSKGLAFEPRCLKNRPRGPQGKKAGSRIRVPPFFFRKLTPQIRENGNHVGIETTLADLRAKAARVCWCKCTGCTTKKVPLRKPRKTKNSQAA